MSPSESFQMLTDATISLARQRSEVDRLWAEWASSFFASMRAKRKLPRLLIVEVAGKQTYFACDCDRETLSAIPPELIEFVREASPLDGVGTDQSHINSAGDSSERLQKATSDSEESSSSNQGLQG